MESIIFVYTIMQALPRVALLELMGGGFQSINGGGTGGHA